MRCLPPEFQPKVSAAPDTLMCAPSGSLRMNNLGEQGAAHLAEALKINHTLLTLEYAALPS